LASRRPEVADGSAFSGFNKAAAQVLSAQIAIKIIAAYFFRQANYERRGMVFAFRMALQKKG
jgi:hypothetical protein